MRVQDTFAPGRDQDVEAGAWATPELGSLPIACSRVTTLSRRDFLLGAATALVAASCTGGGTTTPTSPGPPTSTGKPRSIKDLARGAVPLSLIQAQSELPRGRTVLTFGLSTPQGGLVQGGSPQVFAAPDESSRPIGPFP